MFRKNSIEGLLFTGLIMLIMISTVASNAGKLHLSYGAILLGTDTCKWSSPFPVSVSTKLGFPSSGGTFDVTHSSGVQLINGSSHWEVETDSNYVYRTNLSIQISDSGYHTLTVTFNATGIINPENCHVLPCKSSLYFYATTGLVSCDNDSLRLIQAVNDSAIYPTDDIQRRAVYRRDSLQNVGLNDGRFYSGFRSHHTYSLFDTTIYNNIFGYYSHDQIYLIGSHNLLYAPLRSDCDSIVAHDTTIVAEDSVYTPEQRYKLANLGLSHLKTLYQVDQEIIHTEPRISNWPYLSPLQQLLASRRILVQSYVDTMKAIIK